MCVCAFVSPTVESEWLGEGQNSNVPAVVINVSINKGQVAAVINDRLHFCHVGVDWFIIDGAQQHTPAINKAVTSSMERVTEEEEATMQAFSAVHTQTNSHTYT